MAWLKKNWWVFLLVALTIIWYGVPYAKSVWRREQPYWLSAPGQAVLADLSSAGAVVLVVGVGAQIIVQVVLIAALERVYARSRSEPEQDVSERGAPFPEQGASTLAELIALGFARLGEIEGPSGPRKGQLKLHWLFTDAKKTVRASVAYWKWMVLPSVILHSDFADGAAVVTYFPLGRNIRRPGLWTDADKESIEGAYRLHLSHVQGFEQTHGAPLSVTAVREYLERGASFDQHHGRTMWQVFQLPNILNLVALPLITAAILFYPFFMSRISSVAISPTSDALFVTLLALIGGIIFFVIAIVQARQFLATL